MRGTVFLVALVALLGASVPINSSPVDRLDCPPCPPTCPPCPETTTTTACPPCTDNGNGGNGGNGGGGGGNGDEDGYGPPPDCSQDQLHTLFPSYHAQFFWQCRSINDPLLMPCGPGTVFSYELQLCTWP